MVNLGILYIQIYIQICSILYMRAHEARPKKQQSFRHVRGNLDADNASKNDVGDDLGANSESGEVERGRPNEVQTCPNVIPVFKTCLNMAWSGKRFEDSSRSKCG